MRGDTPLSYAGPDEGQPEKGLGIRIGQARRDAGLTQQELCQKTGLSYSTLAKIERGAIKSPSVFTVSQIANAVGQSVDTILGIESPGGSKTAKKRSKSGVEFVYFDINGCLVRFFHRAFPQIAEKAQKPPDVIETAFWHYNDAVCRGELSMEEFNREMAKKLELKEFDWTNYYLDNVEPVSETAEMVREVAKDYKIGLLSNIMPGLLHGLIAKGLIPDAEYDAIIDSSEVGTIKPEARIYQLAAEQSGVAPGEILLVDDSRTNLMAAGNQGWKVLWFDDYRPTESIDRIKKSLEY